MLIHFHLRFLLAECLLWEPTHLDDSDVRISHRGQEFHSILVFPGRGTLTSHGLFLFSSSTVWNSACSPVTQSIDKNWLTKVWCINDSNAISYSQSSWSEQAMPEVPCTNNFLLHTKSTLFRKQSGQKWVNMLKSDEFTHSSARKVGKKGVQAFI